MQKALHIQYKPLYRISHIWPWCEWGGRVGTNPHPTLVTTLKNAMHLGHGKAPGVRVRR